MCELPDPFNRRTFVGLQLVKGRNVKKAFPSDPELSLQSDDENVQLEVIDSDLKLTEIKVSCSSGVSQL